MALVNSVSRIGFEDSCIVIHITAGVRCISAKGVTQAYWLNRQSTPTHTGLRGASSRKAKGS